MRGETLEAFQRTRNAPGARSSVAGKDAKALAWDKHAARKASAAGAAEASGAEEASAIDAPAPAGAARPGARRARR
jgi:gallate dioxygenase